MEVILLFEETKLLQPLGWILAALGVELEVPDSALHPAAALRTASGMYSHFKKELKP